MRSVVRGLASARTMIKSHISGGASQETQEVCRSSEGEQADDGFLAFGGVSFVYRPGRYFIGHAEHGGEPFANGVRAQNAGVFRWLDGPGVGMGIVRVQVGGRGL